MEASELAAHQPTAVVAVEYPAAHFGVAADDLVLRRFADRTVRDCPGLCRGVFAETTSTGSNGPGFSESIGQITRAGLAGVRRRHSRILASRLASRWFDDGFIGIGCDGSRVECARTEELEQRLGQANKDRAAPSLWVTALVHLRLGVPWAWRIGKGTASERSHLLQMLELLPPALLVADAGYFGFELARQLADKNIHFLLRMSSNVTLYTMQQVSMERFREGLVYYFPAQKHNGSAFVSASDSCSRPEEEKRRVVADQRAGERDGCRWPRRHSSIAGVGRTRGNFAPTSGRWRK